MDGAAVQAQPMKLRYRVARTLHGILDKKKLGQWGKDCPHSITLRRAQPEPSREMYFLTPALVIAASKDGHKRISAFGMYLQN